MEALVEARLTVSKKEEKMPPTAPVVTIPEPTRAARIAEACRGLDITPVEAALIGMGYRRTRFLKPGIKNDPIRVFDGRWRGSVDARISSRNWLVGQDALAVEALPSHASRMEVGIRLEAERRNKLDQRECAALAKRTNARLNRPSTIHKLAGKVVVALFYVSVFATAYVASKHLDRRFNPVLPETTPAITTQRNPDDAY
jgi:hypothetical protein